MINIGEKLRTKRLERKIKQDEIADYLNITQRAYSKMENNEVDIKINSLRKLAEFYEVSISELLSDSQNYKFTNVKECQIGSGKFINNSQVNKLYESIIERQQNEIEYLKGIIEVFRK